MKQRYTILHVIHISILKKLQKKSFQQMKDIMLIIVLASLTNFLTGSIMGPASETEEARGFIGYSSMYTG